VLGFMKSISVMSFQGQEVEDQGHDASQSSYSKCTITCERTIFKRGGHVAFDSCIKAAYGCSVNGREERT